MFSVDGFCIRERMGWLCRELSFILRKSSFEWVDYFLFVQETICDKNKNFFLPRCCVNSSFNNCSKTWHAFFLVFLNFSIILPGSDETRSSEKRIFVLWRKLFNQRSRHRLKNWSLNAVTLFLRFTLHRQRKAMPPWNKNIWPLCATPDAGSAEETEWWNSWNIFWRLWMVWKLLFPNCNASYWFAFQVE